MGFMVFAKVNTQRLGRSLRPSWFSLTVALAALVLATGMTSPSSGNNPESTRLVLLSTSNIQPDSFLYLVEVGKSLPEEPWAMLSHAPRTVVRGVVTPDHRILVVADYSSGSDSSFGSALLAFDENGVSHPITNRLVFASRPVVLPDGRVFVERGEPGRVTDKMRVDSLSIDEVNIKNGATRTIWSGMGYAAHLAGSYAEKLVVYYVDPNGARISLLDPATSDERIVLAALPPFATNFSVDPHGQLVFLNRHSERVGIWQVQLVNLTSGLVRTLRESDGPMAVTIWPDGTEPKIAVTEVANGKNVGGAVVPQAFSADGSLGAGLAPRREGVPPEIVVLNARGEEITRIKSPPERRLEVIGFLP